MKPQITFTRAFVLILLLTWGTLYLLVSFALWDLDLTRWPGGVRFAAALGGMAAAFFALFFGTAAAYHSVLLDDEYVRKDRLTAAWEQVAALRVALRRAEKARDKQEGDG